MKKFNIYLSGGMSGMNMSEQIGWRFLITTLLARYSGVRFEVDCFNPPAYYTDKHPNDYDSEREVMDYDLYRLNQSDMVIVNFNNLKSLGTMAEIAIAHYKHIPIIGIYSGDRGELHPWQENMCWKILGNEEDAAEYIGLYYLT